MRHLIFALMIALLPLRGWVGDAMAVTMAAQQVSAVQASADVSAMPEDCHMLSQSTHPAGEATSTGAGGHCADCNTCQLCLSFATLAVFDPPPAVFQPFAGPAPAGTRFNSADSVVSLKPPIS